MSSQTGKKLMAKCRMLIQENQELGRQLSQGRTAQLEAELALQRKYSQELQTSQDELNDFIVQLDEEVEGMQSTILVLQQHLKEAHQQQQQSQLVLVPCPAPGQEDWQAGATNGSGNTVPIHRTATGPGPEPFTKTDCHTEQESIPDTKPSNSNHSSGDVNQLNEGYETVDSPTGSEISFTQHSTGTDCNQDPAEDGTLTGKGSRTVGSRQARNGLNATA